jgi:hypothetical protein
MARRIRNPDPVWQYLVLFVTFSVLWRYSRPQPEPVNENLNIVLQFAGSLRSAQNSSTDSGCNVPEEIQK